MALEIVQPGLATTVQDLGRPGYYHIGIPLSGGMDRFALRCANMLVGNDEGAAVLEAVFMGPQIRFGEDRLVAVTGATTNILDPFGFLALVAAALMWAVYTLLFRRSNLTPIQSAAMICIWSAGIYLPAYFMFNLSHFQNASGGEIALQAFYQGILMSAVALIAFNRAVTLLGSGASTAIIAIIPALTTLIAIPLLGEFPSLLELLAICSVVVGVILISAPAAERTAADNDVA